MRYFPLARGFTIYSGFRPPDRPDHWGVDFGKEGGSGGLPVFACQGGTVANAGPASGFGQWVCLDHPAADGSGFTVYGHTIPEVVVGQRVEAGQRIARINPDSNTNGGVPPHCHLEVHRSVWSPPGPDRLDPALWLGQADYAGETTTPTGAPVTIFGPDIANFQSGMDLAKVKAEGFDFVFCKVSEGNYFQDRTWPGFRDAARANGLLLAGYHYVRGDNTPDSQADTFVQQLGDNSIPAMLDFEANGGNIDNFWAVLNAIQARGVHVALSYIPHWYWSQIGSPDISTVPGLIQSSYVSGSGYASALYPGDQSGNWAGFGGRAVDILQFTDKASIAGHAVDCNAFRGTRDQLAALLGGTNPTQGALMALSDAEQAEVLGGIRALLNVPNPFIQATEPMVNAVGFAEQRIRTGVVNDLQPHLDAAVAQLTAALTAALAAAPAGAPGSTAVADLNTKLANLTLKAV